jgi:4-hydroxy-2-oxoglutarate aldolase
MTLTGVLAPLPTPFDERDELDVGRLASALRRWTASPLAGFVLLGTNGEAGLLAEDEADRLVGEARTLVPAARTLIVGAGRESTRATVQAARRAGDLGADAVLVRTPSFFRTHMTGEALVRHYSVVADASPVPVLLYNFAAATGVNLLPDAVARLASHGNIIGIKESGVDATHLADLVALSSPTFSVLTGSGSTFYAALRAGVAGGILAIAALLPDACVHLYHLVKDGNYTQAEALQQRLLAVTRVVLGQYGVAGLKAALRLAGVDVGPPRPPLCPVDAEASRAVAAALSSFEGVPA